MVETKKKKKMMNWEILASACQEDQQVFGKRIYCMADIKEQVISK